MAKSATVFRAIAHARKSCNRFLPGKTIENDTLTDILESTLRTPSSFNLQPTQIILVRDQAIKDELAQMAMLGAGNQYRTRDCSALAVFLADQEASARIRRIYELEKQSGTRHPNYIAMMPVSTAFFLGEGHTATLLKQVTTDLVSRHQAMPDIEPIQAWSYKNTALVVQSYVLAATSHDLQTSIMEGVDMRKAKEILRIPDRYSIPMMVATGYEYEKDDTKTVRLDLEEVVFQDTFGEPLRLNEDEETTAASSA